MKLSIIVQVYLILLYFILLHLADITSFFHKLNVCGT